MVFRRQDNLIAIRNPDYITGQLHNYQREILKQPSTTLLLVFSEGFHRYLPNKKLAQYFGKGCGAWFKGCSCKG